MLFHKTPTDINKLQDVVVVIMKLKNDGFLTTQTDYGFANLHSEHSCSLNWLNIVIMVEWISYLHKTEKSIDATANRWLKKLLSSVYLQQLDSVEPNVSRGLSKYANSLADVIDIIEEKAKVIHLNSYTKRLVSTLNWYLMTNITWMPRRILQLC